MNIIKLLCLSAIGLLSMNTFVVKGQDRVVGQWRSHFPYNIAVDVAVNGTTIYVASKESFYIKKNDELQPFSKVDGMADVGMSGIGYDKFTNTVVLAYRNSNIDLYQDGSFYNLPDLKRETVAGSKTINHILTDNGLAYLSTDIGIVVLNLEKKEIKETYTFMRNNRNIAIKSVAIAGNNIYAATEKGIYKAGKNNINLQAFSSWTPLDTSRSFIAAANQQDKIFVAGTDTLFALENDVLRFVYKSDTTIRNINTGLDGLWVVENYKDYGSTAKNIDIQYNFIDSVDIQGWATKVEQRDDPEKTIFIANEFRGLLVRLGSGEPYGTFAPEGPPTNTAFDIFPYNKEVWLAHGGYDEFWTFNNNAYGLSVFKDEKWKNYNNEYFGGKLYDVTTILKGADGNIYAGSGQDGLLILNPADGKYEIFDENSILDDSYIARGKRIVGGLAMDNQQNLWITMFGGDNELAVRTKEGNWFEYPIGAGRPIPHAAGPMVIDDNGQKWYTAPRGGGVVVYNDGGTPENGNDDRYRLLVSGEGFGGLPNNTVTCIAKDKNGAIWIGTNTGIGIVSCPGQVIELTCEAKLTTVQYDDFAGFLFQNDVVRSIAVDGANRKWVGTNNGVWLISPDGDKVISRFTAEDSPLPSNRIQKIAIDPVTGDVYISTESGLVSYRGTSTEGAETMDKIVSYPNPVPSGYAGTIAIRGLAENADVRITDISGQLVYRTKALGGQAVWNGKDYTGRRPQSGVYMIFVSDRDGTQTKSGKLVFME